MKATSPWWDAPTGEKTDRYWDTRAQVVAWLQAVAQEVPGGPAVHTDGGLMPRWDRLAPGLRLEDHPTAWQYRAIWEA